MSMQFQWSRFTEASGQSWLHTGHKTVPIPFSMLAAISAFHWRPHSQFGKCSSAAPLIVSAMRELSGVTPWQATLHAMNLIGSHDTHRVASLLRDPWLVDVAFGMLASYPGVPMIYAGDEIGLATMGPEYARIPMPWAHPERWDQRRVATTRALFGTRAKSVALRRGGLRWLCIADDAIAFLREAPGETVLVHAARANHTPMRIPAAVVGSELVGLVYRRPSGRRRRYDHSSRRWAGVRDVGKSLMKCCGYALDST